MVSGLLELPPAGRHKSFSQTASFLKGQIATHVLPQEPQHGVPVEPQEV